MKPLSIFLINFDWRDIFRTSPEELWQKLERDRLQPGLNSFFFFSWAHVGYAETRGNMRTLHLKTRLYKLKPFLDLMTVLLVPRVIKEFNLKPGVWMTYDFGMLPALWLARRRFGGKVVLCVSNQPRVYSSTRRFGALKSLYSGIVERLWWRIADHIFTINATMKSYLMKLGVPGKDITVFYVDTIDRDMNYIQAAVKGRVRATYGIGADKKVLLSVGRLEAEKDFPRLISLFAGLSPKHILIIIGQGSLEMGLRAQADRLGISDKVIFAGLIPRSEIWNYFLDADAFVLLSKAEALGLVFWESMHVGVPVIGSGADGIVETIGQDGLRGRIWTENDGQDGFNERVRFCLNSSAERSAMIERAKQYVAEQRKNSVTLNDLPIFKL